MSYLAGFIGLLDGSTRLACAHVELELHAYYQLPLNHRHVSDHCEPPVQHIWKFGINVRLDDGTRSVLCLILYRTS